MVYAREVADLELTFGVSGKLIMNALVMYDRQTNSLWSQFLGEGVEGPLEGAKLTLLSSQLLAWDSWKEQHLDTLVLDTGGFNMDAYVRYYFSGAAGVIGESNIDSRLDTKELVVGIVGVASQKAYAYRDLSEATLINDIFEGRSLVVVFNEGGSTSVFDRDVDGRALTFDQGGDPNAMTDRGTGSTWDKTTGKALSGELEGMQLREVSSFASFWFAWTDFYPDTKLYESG